MADQPKIEKTNTPNSFQDLQKRVREIERTIGVFNPRNMAGLSKKDLREAARGQYFGSGSDGDVVVSTEITLTRDMFYNNLTVENGGIINTASYRIFVKGTLNKKKGGIIRNNGGNGSNGTCGENPYGGSGASGIPSGSLPGSIGGARGGNGHGENSSLVASAGGDGSDADKSLGSAGTGGGSGGTGCSDPGWAGGNGGSQTGTIFNIPNSFVSSYYLFDYLPSSAYFLLSAGAGGGGGGNDNEGANYSQAGGGGGGAGAAGGMIWISANKIYLEGENEVQAHGGNGGNGGDGYNSGSLAIAAGGGGGGAGGSGGVIMLVYGTKTGTGTLDISGGNGGNGGKGINGGTDGNPGSDGLEGKTYLIQI